MNRWMQTAIAVAAWMLVPTTAGAWPSGLVEGDDGSASTPDAYAAASGGAKGSASSGGSFGPIPVDLSIGLKGGVSLAGAREVPENVSYQVDGQTRTSADPQYFGLIGFGGGAGLSVDARFYEAVGLETGFQYTADNAEGTNDIESPDGRTRTVWREFQETRAFHIPLLVKGSLPTETVRPYLGLGFEFVVQSHSDLEYEGQDVKGTRKNIGKLNTRNEIEPSSYTMFQSTLGMEVDVGPVRLVPFEFRVGYNLAWSESFDKRVRVESTNAGDRFYYDGEYLGHASIYTGAYYRWDWTL